MEARNSKLVALAKQKAIQDVIYGNNEKHLLDFSDSSSDYIPSEDTNSNEDDDSPLIKQKKKTLENKIEKNGGNVSASTKVKNCDGPHTLNNIINGGLQTPFPTYECDSNFKKNAFLPDDSYNRIREWLITSRHDEPSTSVNPENVDLNNANLKNVDLNNDNPENVDLSDTEEGNDANDGKATVFSSPHLIIHKYKKTTCKFCENEIVSKHFARRLQRRHGKEKEVKEIFTSNKSAHEIRQLVSLLRNEGNLDEALRGSIKPKKQPKDENLPKTAYAICKYCKGFYKRLCLSRHVKRCFANTDEHKTNRPLISSMIYSISLEKYGEYLNKLLANEAVFMKMKADDITRTAIGDTLVAEFGENLFKSKKTTRSLYVISNRIRECGRFIIEIRKLSDLTDMLSILRPENFDICVQAVRQMSKYNAEGRSFGAPSLALHFGTTLLDLSALAKRLVYQKKIPTISAADTECYITNLDRFHFLVKSQWHKEIGSLALKDLNEKHAVKPQLLPVTEDVMKLKKLIDLTMSESYDKLCNITGKLQREQQYRLLLESSLVAVILHNRKRVGDIQYLETGAYEQQVGRQEKTTKNTAEFEEALTENEKILTKNYQRIVSIGKGSRPVVILICKSQLKYFNLISKLREEFNHPSGNNFFFSYPKSDKWIDGCSAIRKYANKCGATYPALLTSCRLRKHIATVTQMLDLQEHEVQQLSKFMGHTMKTHNEFYKLPNDIYQVAKVSKILQLMESGKTAEFKNKTLDEIDINMDEILDEGDNSDSDDPDDPPEVIENQLPSTSKTSSTSETRSTNNSLSTNKLPSTNKMPSASRQDSEKTKCKYCIITV